MNKYFIICPSSYRHQLAIDLDERDLPLNFVTYATIKKTVFEIELSHEDFVILGLQLVGNGVTLSNTDEHVREEHRKAYQ